MTPAELLGELQRPTATDLKSVWQHLDWGHLQDYLAYTLAYINFSLAVSFRYFEEATLHQPMRSGKVRALH